MDDVNYKHILEDFLVQFNDKEDSYEIWGQAVRPPHVITLGELRDIYTELGT